MKKNRKNEFNVDSLYIAELRTVDRKNEDTVTASKFIKTTIITIEKDENYPKGKRCIDIFDGNPYVHYNSAGYAFVSKNLDQVYATHVERLDIKKYFQFKKTATVDELFQLYFALNEIKDNKIQRDIIENSILTDTIEEPKDTILSKVLVIKKAIFEVDDPELQDELLQELTKISCDYIKVLISSKDILSTSKNDIQLETMKLLAALELKISRFINGTDYEKEEDIQNFEKRLKLI